MCRVLVVSGVMVVKSGLAGLEVILRLLSVLMFGKIVLKYSWGKKTWSVPADSMSRSSVVNLSRWQWPRTRRRLTNVGGVAAVVQRSAAQRRSTFTVVVVVVVVCGQAV